MTASLWLTAHEQRGKVRWRLEPGEETEALAAAHRGRDRRWHCGRYVDGKWRRFSRQGRRRSAPVDGDHRVDDDSARRQLRRSGCLRRGARTCGERKRRWVSGGGQPRLRRAMAQRQRNRRRGASLPGEGGGGVRTGAVGHRAFIRCKGNRRRALPRPSNRSMTRVGIETDSWAVQQLVFQFQNSQNQFPAPERLVEVE
jgi:hypothetical protein